jgi:Pentapeptide repeats (9 copies)
VTIEPADQGRSPKGAEEIRYKVLAPAAIWSAAILIVFIGVGTAVWLLVAYGHGGDQARNQLEAIKTAGTVVVGAGGGAALLLTARRQRSAEIALKQKDREQAHQERVAAAAEADAADRRITDLYTKAADQLGSDKAPVRLAGLYALARVAQNNPDQRQTIIDVMCAYLRMPYDPPGQPPEDAQLAAMAAYREQVQEREVRLTAQRLIAEHLKPDEPTFWADIALDLTGATLIDFSLTDCMVRRATFMGATFVGDAHFSSAEFNRRTDFWRANFLGQAWFRRAKFGNDAHLGKTTFRGLATFEGASFHGIADFQSASFNGGAVFRATTFACEPGSADMLARGDAPYTVFDRAVFSAGLPTEVAAYLPGRDQLTR